jgi:transposase-like protein
MARSSTSLLQPRRDRHAAARFFRKLLKRSGRLPRRLVTDRLGSYRAAHRIIMPSVVHDTTRYAYIRAEVSHQRTRQRERHMRRFKSVAQAQRSLAVHDAVATCSPLDDIGSVPASSDVCARAPVPSIHNATTRARPDPSA